MPGAAVGFAELVDIGSGAMSLDGLGREHPRFGALGALELAGDQPYSSTAAVAVQVAAAGNLVAQELRHAAAACRETQINQDMCDGERPLAAVPVLLGNMMDGTGQSCSTGGCRSFRLAALTER